MRKAGLEEAQAGLKIAGRNINNLRYADDTTLMAESEEELNSLLKVKEESEKVGLKLSIQKTMIMAFLHFTANRWGNSGNSDRLYFLELQNHCRWCSEIKRCLLLGKTKHYNQPRQHVKNLRYYLADLGPSSQSFGFSSSHVWM